MPSIATMTEESLLNRPLLPAATPPVGATSTQTVAIMPNALNTSGGIEIVGSSGNLGGSVAVNATTVFATLMAVLFARLRQFVGLFSPFAAKNSGEVASVLRDNRRFGIKIAIFLSILLVLVLAMVRRMLSRIVGRRRRQAGLGIHEFSGGNSSALAAYNNNSNNRRSGLLGGLYELLFSSKQQWASSGQAVDRAADPPTTLGSPLATTPTRQIGASFPHPSRDAAAGATSGNNSTEGGAHLEPMSPKDVYSNLIREANREESQRARHQQQLQQPSSSPDVRVVGDHVGGVGWDKSPSVVEQQRCDNGNDGQCASSPSASLNGSSPAATAAVKIAFSESPALFVKPVTKSPQQHDEEESANFVSLMVKEDTQPPTTSPQHCGDVGSDNCDNRTVKPTPTPNAKKRTDVPASTSSILSFLHPPQPLVSRLKSTSRASSANLPERKIRFSDAPTPLAQPLPLFTAAAAAAAAVASSAAAVKSDSIVEGSKKEIVNSTKEGTATAHDGIRGGDSPTAGGVSNKKSSGGSPTTTSPTLSLNTRPVSNRFGALVGCKSGGGGGGSSIGMDSNFVTGGGKASSSHQQQRTKPSEGSAKRKERKEAEEAAFAEDEASLLAAAEERLKRFEEAKLVAAASSSNEPLPLITTPPQASTEVATTITSSPTEQQKPPSSPVVPVVSALASQHSNVSALLALDPRRCSFLEFRDALVKLPSKPIMSLPDFVMIVGIPGSGKSRWAKEYLQRMALLAQEETQRNEERRREKEDKQRKKDEEAERKGASSAKSSKASSSSSSSSPKPLKAKRYVIVSSDAVRQQLMGSIDDQSQNKLVWEVVLGLCQAHLRNNTSVILDGTNVDTEKRRRFLKRLIMGDKIRLEVEQQQTSSPPSSSSPIATVSPASAAVGISISNSSLPQTPVKKLSSACFKSSSPSSPNNHATSPLGCGGAGGGMRALALGTAGVGLAAATATSAAMLKVQQQMNATHASNSSNLPSLVAALTEGSEAKTAGGLVSLSPTTANSLLQRAEEILLNCGGNVEGLLASYASSASGAEDAQQQSHHHQQRPEHCPIDCNRLLKTFTTTRLICKRRVKEDLEAGVVRSNVPPAVIDLMATQLAEAGSALQEERWMPML